MITNNSQLTAVIDRCRAAVLRHQTATSATPSAQEGQQGPAEPTRPPQITTRPAAPPTPRVVVSLPPAPAGPALAFSAASDLVQGMALSAGALRVFNVLHGVACAVAQVRGYAVAPDTITFHLPQSLAALAVGYTPRHLRRLLPELVAAGVLDWGAHASKVRDMSLWDGCLWCVKVQAGADVLPHIRREEWRHGWRDFAGDIEAGNTVTALVQAMSSLHTDDRENAVKSAVTAWAVNPFNAKAPLLCREDMPPREQAGGVQDVQELVYRLGELPHTHHTRRAALVGRLASGLAAALDDRHSRRWYCAVIWQAWQGEVEGRGSLQGLIAALLRLEADRREWEGLRNPAALLASRLRSA